MVPQVAMTLINFVLPQLADEVIHYQDENMDGDDFRRRCARKVNKARAALCDPGHWQESVIALWGGEPVEALDAALQHLEGEGQALTEAVHPTGCVFQCQK